MVSSRKKIWAAAIFAVLFGQPVVAQDNGGQYLSVEFPRDSPVLQTSISLGDTTLQTRGMSVVINVRASLMLRNTSSKQISGLTLRVEAQDVTPSGKGSITLTSLAVPPGEVFPVRIPDMQLTRPLGGARAGGPMVQVSLDCALFNDLSAYGPDKLGSRRILMVYELQARRDRKYLADLLHTGRLAELREQLNFGLQDFNSQAFELELLREPRIRNVGGQPITVGAMSFPSAPVQAVGGAAHITGNEVTASQVDVRNSSRKTVRSLDMGWIVRDASGNDFLAGSVPAAVQLAPIQTERLNEPGILRFSSPKGQPMMIEAILAFVNDVEFSDGNLWIPSRGDIEAATNDKLLRRALAASPEQQRLADIYRRKGIGGLADELRKVN